MAWNKIPGNFLFVETVLFLVIVSFVKN